MLMLFREEENRGFLVLAFWQSKATSSKTNQMTKFVFCFMPEAELFVHEQVYKKAGSKTRNEVGR
jgi:hypothetical protein